MQCDLNERIAIVTGGSKGYGRGIAEALKAAGCRVWITGRDAGALAAAAKELGVQSVRADITCPDAWDEVMAQVLSAGGRLDILVNNAGAGVHIAPVVEQSDEDVLQSIAVNLTGAILGCRRAAAIMARQQSGTIINVSSVCATHAWPGWGVYSAAKAGLVQFSKSLYLELRPAGVRVTSIIPSWGATEFADRANLGPRDEQTLRNCIQPAELGKLVVDVCSLPPHLAVQDLTLWPMIQEVMPL